MLLKTLVSIHSKLSQSREEIQALGTEFQEIEEAVSKYNSVTSELRIVENQISITENSLNNIKNLIDAELKNIEDLKSRINGLETIKEIQIISVNTNKVSQLTKDANNLLSDLDDIKTFLINRAKKLRLVVYGSLGLGATGIGINYEHIINFIKTILQ